MLATKRFSAVSTTLLVGAALATLAMHSTAIGAKPSGGGTTATYTLTDLRGFSTYAWANGLGNPNLQTGIVEIVGASNIGNEPFHAALWELMLTGAVRLNDLGNPLGNNGCAAVTVNGNGLILGTGPAFVDLPGIGRRILPEISASALNSLGDVACIDTVWSVDFQGNVAKLIEFTDSRIFQVFNINDLRVMAGTQNDIPAKAWFTDPADPIGTLQVRKLGLLAGTTFGRAYAINIWGDVVGECGESNGDGTYSPHAFLWTEAAGMIALGDFGGRSSRALDINDDRHVVGWATSASSGSSRRAFLWEKGKMSDLNILSGAGGKRTLEDASAINDYGQIVGSLKVSGPGNERHAYVLTPKP